MNTIYNMIWAFWEAVSDWPVVNGYIPWSRK